MSVAASTGTISASAASQIANEPSAAARCSAAIEPGACWGSFNSTEQHGGINGCHHRESGGGIHRRSFPSASARVRAIFQRDRWPISSRPPIGRSRCKSPGPAREPGRVARTARAARAIGHLLLAPQSCLQTTVIAGIRKPYPGSYPGSLFPVQGSRFDGSPLDVGCSRFKVPHWLLAVTSPPLARQRVPEACQPPTPPERQELANAPYLPFPANQRLTLSDCMIN